MSTAPIQVAIITITQQTAAITGHRPVTIRATITVITTSALTRQARAPGSRATRTTQRKPAAAIQVRATIQVAEAAIRVRVIIQPEATIDRATTDQAVMATTMVRGSFENLLLFLSVNRIY